jgi:hypothetical protein
MQEGDLAPVIDVTDTVARQRRLLTDFPRSTKRRKVLRQPAPYLNCDRTSPPGARSLTSIDRRCQIQPQRNCNAVGSAVATLQ